MERLFGESLLRIAGGIDRFMARLGRVIALLGFATVLICFLSVYLRYALGVGYSWLQESYVWTHVVVLMLGSGYCLLKGGFVRVDMLYAKASRRSQAWIDLLGAALFTMPFLLMTGWYGWPFFKASWQMGERSAYEDGIGALYLLKGTLMAFALVLGLQVVSSICRSAAVLAGAEPEQAKGDPA